MEHYDVLVVGGGIAGTSIGYELAADRRVCLLEMEDRLGYHTTGRSVATFLESYGGRIVRALTTASRAFMEHPPDGFATPLLTPLPLIWVAPHGQEADLHAMAESVAELTTMELLDADEVDARAGVFQPGWVAAGAMEPGASEVDVAALHQGFAGGLRRRGGDVVLSAGVAALTHDASGWTAVDRAGRRYHADVVVNAAGAWCDHVAALAGIAPIGIEPKRRTVLTFAPPASVDTAGLPLCGDVASTFYFKREGPHVLASPADEVPSEPCDARPDELDVAQAIDVLNAATTFDIRSVKSSWAGLRSFVADRSPVAGFDLTQDGFFWFVGQGGYGIQIAPALAAAGAAIVRGEALPDALTARGLDAATLGPARLLGATRQESH